MSETSALPKRGILPLECRGTGPVGQGSAKTPARIRSAEAFSASSAITANTLREARQ